MNRKSRSIITVPLALIPLAIGCSSAPEEREASYTTVAEVPGRDTSEARRLHAEAVEKIERADYEGAQASLERALSADVTYGPAHNSLGKVYYHLERLYLAAWEFQYAIKLMPKRPEPRNNLGLVFEKVGKLEDAVQHYEEACALAPDDPELLGNLARARVRRGDRGAEMKELLEEIVLKDERPEWVEWARGASARMRD